MFYDIAQTIVTTMTTALFQANRAGRQIDLVMSDEQVADCESVLIEEASERPAAEVHIALRFDEPDLAAGQINPADVSIEPFLVANLRAGAARQFVYKPKPGVMQRPRVTLLGIAEARYRRQICGHNTDLRKVTTL